MVVTIYGTCSTRVLYIYMRIFGTGFQVYFVRYYVNDFETHAVGTNITGIAFVCTLHIRCIFILRFYVVFVVVVSE